MSVVLNFFENASYEFSSISYVLEFFLEKCFKTLWRGEELNVKNRNQRLKKMKINQNSRNCNFTKSCSCSHKFFFKSLFNVNIILVFPVSNTVQLSRRISFLNYHEWKFCERAIVCKQYRGIFSHCIIAYRVTICFNKRLFNEI